MERVIAPMTPSRIAVFGLGYVGSVTAACLASLGHRVTGVDRDEHKVSQLSAGKAPFYEAGLEDIVKSTAASGLLSATALPEKALADADIALVCVGTPSERNGNLGLDQVRRVVEQIAATLPKRTKPLIFAMRSTVFPGTLEEVVLPVLAGHNVALVSNPEFLREGSAVKDFMEPSLIVVGGSDQEAVKRVAGIYDRLGGEPCLVSLRTAEMIKYACNAFHAVKISFANEIGALCHTLAIPAQEVMATLCSDVRLNTSSAYLKPGFAFGGSCLPKDLRALEHRAARLDLKLPLLMNTLESNQRHLERAIQAVMDLNAPRVGVIGLAFKENTDDLRESPAVTLLEYLIGKGKQVRVWDPYIRLKNIYGSNREFVLGAIPHIEGLLMDDVEDVLGWASHVVVTQAPSAEVAQQIVAAELPVLELWRA
jgi:GDP-mannose 6-dehydrogenase